MRSDGCLLVFNGGSSTVKFAVFDRSLEKLLSGTFDRVGRPESTLLLRRRGSADPERRPLAAPDAAACAPLMRDFLAREAAAGPLAAIGHRIVRGGPDRSAARRIDVALIRELEGLAFLDPEHLPGELALIAACEATWPSVPQVACFDTAFHREMPRVARLLPIPRRYLERGVERYGFHGLSYASLLRTLETLDPAAAEGRIVLAHLGNGASLAAVRNGKPMDTTMAFTPAAGIPMGTRSGDLDPGLAAYFARTEHASAQRFAEIATRESGLLGLSETTSDVRELLARESSDARAADALAVFCYAVRKAIGAFAAALGGLETLVFSGGIGEHAAPIRERVCAELEFLGVALDPARNAAHAPVISKPEGRVAVFVLATDEESEIARGVVSRLAPAGTTEAGR